MQTQTAPESPNIVRSLDLNPEDWHWATWRPRTPLTCPEPQPFNRSEALQSVKDVFVPLDGSHQPHMRYRVEWSRAKISVALSPEEAYFWLAAINYNFDNTDPGIQDLLTFLESVDITEPLSLEKAITTLIWSGRRTWKTPELILPLAHFFELDEIFTSLVELSLLNNEQLLSYGESQYDIQKFLESHGFNPKVAREFRLLQVSEKIRTSISSLLNTILAPGLQRYLLPYLSDETIATLRQKLVPVMNRALPAIASLPYYLAYRDQWLKLLPVYLRMHNQVKDCVEAWPNPREYAGLDRLEIIFGLGSADLVETHTRRLQFLLVTPSHIRAWLAHTEYKALDWVCESIVKAEKKEHAAQLIAVFALVKAPEAAPHMLKLMISSKVPQLARQWLEANPDHAIAGLLPIATGTHQLASAATNLLKSLKQQGHGTRIEAALAHGSEAIAAKIQADVLSDEATAEQSFTEQTTPDWLSCEIKTLQRKKATLPSWVSLPDLPSVQVGEYVLNTDQTNTLLLALKQSTLDSPHPLTKALKQQAQSKTLDAFVWRLFELWLNEGAPSKDKWAMMALSHLGSDAIALKLTPLIRVWPGEKQHPRAVVGLDCLRAMGTDTAIMQIHGLSQTLKFRALKVRAQECMAAIARDRNLTPEELEDRIVPTLGLDPRNMPIFDFGDRQFQCVVGSDLKAKVRDGVGKLKADLPKAGAKDNAEMTEQAIATWKLLKKQISEVLRIQKTRLENAMATERRWAGSDFERLLVQHPLMTHLSQGLVWGGYDESDHLIGTFRVAEDQTYTNEKDEAIALTNFAKVGIVHPLHLGANLKANWGQLLSEYEIIPPFAQINREMFALEPAEQNSKAIQRFKAINIMALAQRAGWHRNSLYDNYDDPSWVCWKHFPKAQITTVVGGDFNTPMQCRFVEGLHSYTMFPDSRKDWGLPLNQVDPVIVSEVIRDLSALAIKEA